MDKAQKGKAGEDFACRVLAEKGYRIVERNHHSRYGEIDIIAENDNALAFVEVKARKKNSKTMPREAVDIRKQRKIILTAMLYLQTHQAQKPPRFDGKELKDYAVHLCRDSQKRNSGCCFGCVQSG